LHVIGQIVFTGNPLAFFLLHSRRLSDALILEQKDLPFLPLILKGKRLSEQSHKNLEQTEGHSSLTSTPLIT
jgi:hypothetical protein